MHEYTTLNDIFAAAGRGQLTPVQLKGPTFGRKRFYQTQLQGRPVWVKQYPDIDMPMLLTGDSDRRELKFVASDLPGRLGGIFELPYLGASPEQAMVAMRDIGEELRRFGPPNLPTAEQIQALVQGLARKDAIAIEKRDWMAAPEHSFRVMKELILGFETGNLSRTGMLCLELWPWMRGSLNHLRQKHAELYLQLIKTYTVSCLEQDLASLPGSLQHGDFYFSNIGFDNDGRPVVIDWETVTYGPPGLDLAMLLDGMPPLPFMGEVTGWYLTAFNQNSREPMTEARLKQIMDVVGLRSLLVAELVDVLRFAISDDSALPEAARTGMLADYQDRLLQAS